MSSKDNPEFGFDDVEDNFLSADERQACKLIAVGDAPWSERALALLAIDDDAGEEETSAKSGLAPPQVRYWVGRFLTDRLAIFPIDVLFPVMGDTEWDVHKLPPSVVNVMVEGGDAIVEQIVPVEVESAIEPHAEEGEEKSLMVEEKSKKKSKKGKKKEKTKKYKKKKEKSKKDKKKDKGK